MAPTGKCKTGGLVRSTSDNASLYTETFFSRHMQKQVKYCDTWITRQLQILSLELSTPLPPQQKHILDIILEGTESNVLREAL